MTTVLVTGATGNVGRHVVRRLLERGMHVVAASHDDSKVRDLFGETVAATRLDFLDQSTWPGALGGATRTFLMRPPAIADVQNNINPFVDFARAHGVDHVVFLSVAGAGKNKVVPHRKVEDHLRLRGEHHTNLRPGFFAQNLESAYRQDIVNDGRIYVPAGRKQPVNWIDARDIAEVAALVLAEPGPHRAQNYTLAGRRRSSPSSNGGRPRGSAPAPPGSPGRSRPTAWRRRATSWRPAVAPYAEPRGSPRHAEETELKATLAVSGTYAKIPV